MSVKKTYAQELSTSPAKCFCSLSPLCALFRERTGCVTQSVTKWAWSPQRGGPCCPVVFKVKQERCSLLPWVGHWVNGLYFLYLSYLGFMAYLETAVCLSPNLGDFQLLFLKHSFFLGFSPSFSNCYGRLHLGPLAL